MNNKAILINGYTIKRSLEYYLISTFMAEQAYCVKCREKRDIVDPQEVTMKGKGGKTRPAMTGTCGTCGTKMFRIMPSKK